jgi:RNA polymerase sigma-70 factor (ECF subfamily)
LLSFFFATGLSATRAAADDDSLLGAVARRDRHALRRLYDRFGGQVLAVGLRVLSSRADAEEVTQEVFVEVWSRADRFDPERGSARAWLMGIARNRAIDRLRRRQADSRMAEAVRDEERPRGPTPVEDAEARELRDRVRAALMSLGPEQRTALELAYYEGLSQSEIAERLDAPLGTVKSRVRLAMERLAQLLPGGGER